MIRSPSALRDHIIDLIYRQRIREDGQEHSAFFPTGTDFQKTPALEQSALQGIARIQTRRGQFDDALKTLNRAAPDKLQGAWKTNITKSIDEVQKARK